MPLVLVRFASHPSGHAMLRFTSAPMILLSQPGRLTRFVATALCISTVLLILPPYNPYRASLSWGDGRPRHRDRPVLAEVVLLEQAAQSFIDSPISQPYKEQYGELGKRTQRLRDWLSLSERHLQTQKRRGGSCGRSKRRHPSYSRFSSIPYEDHTPTRPSPTSARLLTLEQKG